MYQFHLVTLVNCDFIKSDNDDDDRSILVIFQLPVNYKYRSTAINSKRKYNVQSHYFTWNKSVALHTWSISWNDSHTTIIAELYPHGIFFFHWELSYTPLLKFLVICIVGTYNKASMHAIIFIVPFSPTSLFHLFPDVFTIK